MPTLASNLLGKMSPDDASVSMAPGLVWRIQRGEHLRCEVADVGENGFARL
jgi:hypothetical protein